MRQSCYVIDVPVWKHTTHHDIYTITEKHTEAGTWYYINGDTGYDAKQWTLEEAINNYLSPEGRESRDDSFRRAWGFYD